MRADRFFGVPEHDHARFLGWSDHVLVFQGVNRPIIATLEKAQHALLQLRAYLEALIDDRRRERRDDLMSTLVPAESDGERLSNASSSTRRSHCSLPVMRRRDH